jgi:hypothetical protein
MRGVAGSPLQIPIDAIDPPPSDVGFIAMSGLPKPRLRCLHEVWHPLAASLSDPRSSSPDAFQSQVFQSQVFQSHVFAPRLPQVTKRIF